MGLRNLILKIVPDRMAASMEAESREWMMRCLQCNKNRWADVYRKRGEIAA